MENGVQEKIGVEVRASVQKETHETKEHMLKNTKEKVKDEEQGADGGANLETRHTIRRPQIRCAVPTRRGKADVSLAVQLQL